MKKRSETYAHKDSKTSQTQRLPQPDAQELDLLAGMAEPAAALKRVAAASPLLLKPSDVLALQQAVGNQAVQRLLAERVQRQPTPEKQGLWAHELTHHVLQQEAAGGSIDESTIQRADFDQSTPEGNRLRVQTESVEPSGEVRHWAAPSIITPEGDRVPYHIQVDVMEEHRPYSVVVGVRRAGETLVGEVGGASVGASVVRRRAGETLVERVYSRIQLLHWRQADRLSIPAHAEPTSPAEEVEFFVRLEPSGGDEIEYTSVLAHNQDAIELARVLNGEGGSSSQGMAAIAHVVQNRLDEGRPARQVDTSSHPPRNYINTAYLLRGSSSAPIPASWRRSPSTASREVAQAIIQAGGAIGGDPTDGALFYCTAGTERRLESRPGGAFHRLGRQVEQGFLRRITVAGNTFYGRGPQAGSAPPGMELYCRRP